MLGPSPAPYRDANESATARADRLERENESLRAELARREGRTGALPLLSFPIVALAALVLVAITTGALAAVVAWRGRF